MKANLTLGHCTFIGVEGNNIKEIKDKIAYNEGLSCYGRNLLFVVQKHANIKIEKQEPDEKE